MAKIKSWCGIADQNLGNHLLRVITSDAAKIATGVTAVANSVPEHYVSARRVAHVLKTLGKPAAAALVTQKLPTTKAIRSGDLGEILGAAYIDEFTPYSLVVKRLRWKDHRNMAMRGDDLIGIAADPAHGVVFMKGEAKSCVALSNATIGAARKALNSHERRPSPHALGFIADRAFDLNIQPLGDLIDAGILGKAVKLAQVEHLLFVLTGSDPENLLKTELNSYSGKVRQSSVGLRVKAHQKFIADVFDEVIANGV